MFGIKRSKDRGLLYPNNNGEQIRHVSGLALKTHPLRSYPELNKRHPKRKTVTEKKEMKKKTDRQTDCFTVKPERSHPSPQKMSASMSPIT